MKYLNHKFTNIPNNMPIYSLDICSICNRTANDIDDRIFGLTSDYIKENSNMFPKCLTEEEYTIKKLLE